MPRRPVALALRLPLAAGAVAVLAAVGIALLRPGADGADAADGARADAAPPALPGAAPDQAPVADAPPSPKPTDDDPGPPAALWTDPAPGSLLHGSSYGADGFTVFRGNPTRTFYGVGPVPREPSVAWSAPDERRCSIEGDLEDGGREWCGIGWTGQVLLREDADGAVEVIVGAYDGGLHFHDGATGTATRPSVMTDQMVKGTGALDPDGFPLAVFGSRDGFLRVVALDREVPTELWRLGRHPQGVWNDDWDASPTILDDVLHAAGEDGWFRMWRLHRAYGPDGLVTVDPELVLEVPGFDDELIARLGDRNVSIESSPAVTADRVYWVNSGGRVMGIDRVAALDGRAHVTLDVWLGDDGDASIVVDRDGMLYVALEEERRLPAAAGMGQLVKLDPSRPDDPVVWRLEVPSDPTLEDGDGGIWATPALYGEHLFVPTNAGDLLVVDRADGAVVWRERLGGPLWSSPAVVEEPGGPAWLVVATCANASLRGYTLEDPAAPELRWRVPLPGCVEATPVVWEGSIYVGTRDGRLHAVR
ncbi:MAG: PQQ-binding-like beta-propeller repeat protein [Nitriliruptoraceae bacterium]